MTFEDPRLAAWVDAVVARHTSSFSRPEFLKAVRALSSRYVQQRAALPGRSPLDSPGKRAAFAGFYAPLHLLTAYGALRQLLPGRPVPAEVHDLGSGTGVAGAAWALASAAPPRLTCVDLNSWVLNEARWNLRTLGLTGRTHRGDLVEALARVLRHTQNLSATGIICGWSLNELAAPPRDQALAHLLDAASRGAQVVVIEPVATSAVPWWAAWESRATAAGARADLWRIDDALPPALASLDRDAGFDREALTARSVHFSGAGVGLR
jgi:hypothetical protein